MILITLEMNNIYTSVGDNKGRLNVYNISLMIKDK